MRASIFSCLARVIGRALVALGEAAVREYFETRPPYPKIRVEKLDYSNDIVLVWSEHVPVEFQYQVAQAVRVRFIGERLVPGLLSHIEAYANGLVIDRVNRGDIWRLGGEWTNEEVLWDKQCEGGDLWNDPN